MPGRLPSYRPAMLAGPSRHQVYDRAARNREADRFYSSAAWVSIRRSKLACDPLCEVCKALGMLVPARVVHHRVGVLECIDGRLDMDNLQSLCASCHSRLHASGSHDDRA